MLSRDWSEDDSCGKEIVVDSPRKDLNVWVLDRGLKNFSPPGVMNERSSIDGKGVEGSRIEMVESRQEGGVVSSVVVCCSM